MLIYLLGLFGLLNVATFLHDCTRTKEELKNLIHKVCREGQGDSTIDIIFVGRAIQQASLFV